MKKAICILLAAILLTGTVSGCAVKEENPPETTEKVPALSVEQAVLFEKPYATVSAQAITQTGTQYKLELTVSNTGTEELEVRVGDAAVNGLNVPAECSGYFPARGTGTVDVTMDCSTAFLWGMDKLETVTPTGSRSLTVEDIVIDATGEHVGVVSVPQQLVRVPCGDLLSAGDMLRGPVRNRA